MLTNEPHCKVFPTLHTSDVISLYKCTSLQGKTVFNHISVLYHYTIHFFLIIVNIN